MAKASDVLKKKYAEMGIQTPSLHMVLGSGIGLAFEEITNYGSWTPVGQIKFAEIPGINPASTPGHAGVFKYFKHKTTNRAICFQVGRLHGYEGLEARDAVSPVMSARLAGTQNFVLTNAAGSLRKDFSIGSVMVMRDHVNLTGKNPLVGHNPTNEDGKPLGPRFPDLSRGYNPEMRAELSKTLVNAGIETHEGTYIGLLGPSFETPAEIAMFARWGMDAVGMSTVWECIALNHSGARVAGLSFISNLGCGLTPEPLDHEEVLSVTGKYAKKFVEALFAYAEKFSG